jgi:hypothetical protein
MTPRLQGWIIAGATIWSAAMLTAGYLGFAKPDSAFVASILGSAIGAAGITIKDGKPKPPAKPRLTRNPPPPTP